MSIEFLEKAERLLQSRSRKTIRADFSLQDYLGTKYEVMNVPLPDIRNCLAELMIDLNKEEADYNWELFKYLSYESVYWEVKQLGFLYATKVAKKHGPEWTWNAIEALIPIVDNWAFSDTIASLIMQVLKKKPEATLAKLRTWNLDANKWKRRNSIVGLIAYGKKQENVVAFSEVLDLIVPLIDDAEYFVQKGVGWALRELYVAYPPETLAFMQKNVEYISATAYSAASEKWPKEIKDQMREKRKLARKKG